MEVRKSKVLQKYERPILYYDDLNADSRASLLLLNILDVDVELRLINLVKGEHLTDEYKAINPAMIVPTFVHKEISLTGHSILLYVCENFNQGYAKQLFATDCYRRQLRIINRLFFESRVLHRRHGDLMTELVLKTFNNTNLDYHQKRIFIAYDAMEAFLEKHVFMSTDMLTLSDIALISTVDALDLMFPIEDNKERWGKLYNWTVRMHSLPQYKIISNGIEKERKVVEHFGRFIFPKPELGSISSARASQTPRLTVHSSQRCTVVQGLPKPRQARKDSKSMLMTNSDTEEHEEGSSENSFTHWMDNQSKEYRPENESSSRYRGIVRSEASVNAITNILSTLWEDVIPINTAKTDLPRIKDDQSFVFESDMEYTEEDLGEKWSKTSTLVDCYQVELGTVTPQISTSDAATSDSSKLKSKTLIKDIHSQTVSQEDAAYPNMELRNNIFQKPNEDNIPHISRVNGELHISITDTHNNYNVSQKSDRLRAEYRNNLHGDERSQTHFTGNQGEQFDSQKSGYCLVEHPPNLDGQEGCASASTTDGKDRYINCQKSVYSLAIYVKKGEENARPEIAVDIIKSHYVPERHPQILKGDAIPNLPITKRQEEHIDANKTSFKTNMIYANDRLQIPITELDGGNRSRIPNTGRNDRYTESQKSCYALDEAPSKTKLFGYEEPQISTERSEDKDISSQNQKSDYALTQQRHKLPTDKESEMSITSIDSHLDYTLEEFPHKIYGDNRCEMSIVSQNSDFAPTERQNKLYIDENFEMNITHNQKESIVPQKSDDKVKELPHEMYGDKKSHMPLSCSQERLDYVSEDHRRKLDEHEESQLPICICQERSITLKKLGDTSEDYPPKLYKDGGSITDNQTRSSASQKADDTLEELSHEMYGDKGSHMSLSCSQDISYYVSENHCRKLQGHEESTTPQKLGDTTEDYGPKLYEDGESTMPVAGTDNKLLKDEGYEISIINNQDGSIASERSYCTQEELSHEMNVDKGSQMPISCNKNRSVYESGEHRRELYGCEELQMLLNICREKSTASQKLDDTAEDYRSEIYEDDDSTLPITDIKEKFVASQKLNYALEHYQHKVYEDEISRISITSSKNKSIVFQKSDYVLADNGHGIYEDKGSSRPITTSRDRPTISKKLDIVPKDHLHKFCGDEGSEMSIKIKEGCVECEKSTKTRVEHMRRVYENEGAHTHAIHNQEENIDAPSLDYEPEGYGYADNGCTMPIAGSQDKLIASQKPEHELCEADGTKIPITVFQDYTSQHHRHRLCEDDGFRMSIEGSQDRCTASKKSDLVLENHRNKLQGDKISQMLIEDSTDRIIASQNSDGFLEHHEVSQMPITDSHDSHDRSIVFHISNYSPDGQCRIICGDEVSQPPPRDNSLVSKNSYYTRNDHRCKLHGDEASQMDSQIRSIDIQKLDNVGKVHSHGDEVSQIFLTNSPNRTTIHQISNDASAEYPFRLNESAGLQMPMTEGTDCSIVLKKPYYGLASHTNTLDEDEEFDMPIANKKSGYVELQISNSSAERLSNQQNEKSHLPTSKSLTNEVLNNTTEELHALQDNQIANNDFKHKQVDNKSAILMIVDTLDKLNTNVVPNKVNKVAEDPRKIQEIASCNRENRKSGVSNTKRGKNCGKKKHKSCCSTDYNSEITKLTKKDQHLNKSEESGNVDKTYAINCKRDNPVKTEQNSFNKLNICEIDGQNGDSNIKFCICRSKNSARRSSSWDNNKFHICRASGGADMFNLEKDLVMNRENPACPQFTIIFPKCPESDSDSEDTISAPVTGEIKLLQILANEKLAEYNIPSPNGLESRQVTRTIEKLRNTKVGRKHKKKGSTAKVRLAKNTPAESEEPTLGIVTSLIEGKDTESVVRTKIQNNESAAPVHSVLSKGERSVPKAQKSLMEVKCTVPETVSSRTGNNRNGPINVNNNNNNNNAANNDNKPGGTSELIRRFEKHFGYETEQMRKAYPTALKTTMTQNKAQNETTKKSKKKWKIKTEKK